MQKRKLSNELRKILNFICVRTGERPTGSDNNKRIAEYAQLYLLNEGFNIELQKFPCIDWKNGGAELIYKGHKINANPSYYTTGCNLEAEYRKVSTIEELKKSNLKNKIAVLYDQLVQEQIIPKSFPFYNPDHHKKIIKLLEKKKPLAIVTIVDRDISIFEDGDFNIPSVYVKKAEEKILLNDRERISLKIKTTRKPSSGTNVIGRINAEKNRKIVITAHLDTKYGTPGALDNGTGIAILLLLSSLIKKDDINYCLELLLLNGEDYYSIPGQIKYSEKYLTKNNNISLAINCDGVGLKNSITAVSFMEIEKRQQRIIDNLTYKYKEIEINDPWVEGDHMLFVMKQIPALAITSKKIFDIIDDVVHTNRDNLDIIDTDKVIKTIIFLEEFLQEI